MRQELAGLTMVGPALHVRFAQGSFSVAPFNVQDAAIFTVETRPAKHFEAVQFQGIPQKAPRGWNQRALWCGVDEVHVHLPTPRSRPHATAGRRVQGREPRLLNWRLLILGQGLLLRRLLGRLAQWPPLLQLRRQEARLLRLPEIECRHRTRICHAL